MTTSVQPAPTQSRQFWPSVIFSLAALVFIGAGFIYYQVEIQALTQQKHRELSAIGDLKARQIIQWRAERLWDAFRFSHDPLAGQAVKELLANRDTAQVKHSLETLLRLEQHSSRADDVLIVAIDGSILASAKSDPIPVLPQLKKAISESLEKTMAVISNFYRGPDGVIYLDILEPVASTGSPPQAVVVFRINAASYLYPLIQSWPIPSDSAETLLVQREGNDVILQSDLRGHPDSALSLRIPLSSKSVPAVQAVLGCEGLFSGQDYNGTPVLGDLHQIPHSPWALVAKVDTKEILAEAHYRAIVICLIVALVILLCISGIAFLNRQRKVRILQNLFETQKQLADAQAKELAVQQLLAEEQNQLRTLVDLLPAAVFIKNLKSEFLLANNKCAEFMCTDSPLNLLGKTDADFYPAEWAASFLRDELNVIHGIPLLSKEQDGMTKDGSRQYLLTTKVPLRDPDGRIIGIVGASYDISERKIIEDKLQATLEDLERSNKELEHFTYAVSHDLKAPLVTINSFVNFLQQDLAANDTVAVANDIGYIRSAADKMGRLLGELLELARGGRAVDHPEDVSLQHVIREATDLLAGQIASKNVRISVSDIPVTLHGDRSRLVAVFQNLIDNAIKFLGDQPDPHIELGVEIHEGSPVFFVRDNGKGILSHQQDKIFTMFSKLDSGATGSGIGLALVRSIIEAHGGKIRVQSEGEGLGSVFFFTLANSKIESSHAPLHPQYPSLQ